MQLFVSGKNSTLSSATLLTLQCSHLSAICAARLVSVEFQGGLILKIVLFCKLSTPRLVAAYQIGGMIITNRPTFSSFRHFRCLRSAPPCWVVDQVIVFSEKVLGRNLRSFRSVLISRVVVLELHRGFVVISKCVLLVAQRLLFAADTKHRLVHYSSRNVSSTQV